MSISEPMHMPEPVCRIEVFTGAGWRRIWSAEEKAAIVAESYADGGTVCAVARRHALTQQQLFTWRRLARAMEQTEAPALFVPAVVGPVPPEPSLVVKPRPRTRRRVKLSGIELEVGDVTVRVGADASSRAIAAVIRALKAGS